MYRKLITVFIFIVLTGCANTATVKLSSDISTNMVDKRVGITSSERPDFAAMTADKAMFAVVGAFAMISAGNTIIRENNVADPAVYIGKEFANDIATSWSLNVEDKPIQSSDNDISHLVMLHSEFDYLLDVRTHNWSFVYFPTDWDTYRVLYHAKLRLIDVKKNQVVAEAFCSHEPEESEESPSYDELLNDNAKGLKQELHLAAEYCVNDFRAKLL